MSEQEVRSRPVPNHAQEGDMTDTLHVFEGHDYSTIGGLFDTALWAAKNFRAATFLAAYRAESEHADANLGYVIGYGDEHSRKLMYDAYKLTHPVLGGTP